MAALSQSSHHSEEDEETVRVVSRFLQWKRSVPVLYDLFRAERLDSPSLFVEWLPGVDRAPGDSEHTLQRLLLGTQAEGNEPV